MNEPLAFILDVFCDQFAQVSVAVVDPFPWVDAWLDENKRLIEEVKELFHRAFRLLEQDCLLQLGAEHNFVAADEAKVG